MTTVKDVMTPDPILLDTSDTVHVAAQRMRDADVGAVLVETGGTLRGIVTDRDLVVRTVAEALDPQQVTVGQALSGELVDVGPDDSIDDAIELMRSHAIRRVPVVDHGVAVGILALGDLAQRRDPSSVLGQISAAPASH